MRELVESCKTGAVTNIINGLARGCKSVIVPVFILAFIIFLSFELCDLYGVALAAVGMLGNLATGLSIDTYGSVCDNAGGIAEMAELHKDVCKLTDTLDAAGNTTVDSPSDSLLSDPSPLCPLLYMEPTLCVCVWRAVRPMPVWRSCSP
jgi:Na+/H+-translocating membrane pyrophosphatase